MNNLLQKEDVTVFEQFLNVPETNDDVTNEVFFIFVKS